MKDYSQTLHAPATKLGAILMVIALVLSGCSGGGAQPTEVKITEPTPGTTISVGQGTVIKGEANGDSITRVEVVIDGKAYASLSTPDKTKGVPNFPVSVPWTPMSAGTHAIQLRAFGLEDKMLGQSEPLVMDAQPATQPATATAPPTQAVPPTAAPAATATGAGNSGGQPATAQATQAAGGTTTGDTGSGPSLKVTSDVGYVNVREGPSTSYRLLGRLENNQTAPVRGKSQDGEWWQISYAAGSNGVGWVNGEYVQANAAANSVPVASAPPLPTQPPVPTSPPQPVATQPPPTAAVPPTAIASLPTTGGQGRLRVNKNPIQPNETVYVSWDVQQIDGIWFDKGDGSGYQAAMGTTTNLAVTGITSPRTVRLKWTKGGVESVDELTIGVVGQAVAATATTTTATCNSSNPDWRGGNPNYPFCVRQDMDWIDGGDPVRYFGSRQDINIGVRWNVYGIAGLWLMVEPNGDRCPAGASASSRNVAANGQGSYSWNVKDFENGGYKISLRVLRNDGVEVRHNEKYMCIGVGSTSPTNPPATNPPPPNPPQVTEVPLPTAQP